MLRAFALSALFAAPVAADPYEEIRVLDVVAGFELEALKGRCGDPSQPDLEAAAAAERAAHIHQTRIGLARKIAAAGPDGPGPEELVPLAFQAADAWDRQFACDPAAAAPLESARVLLAGLRAELSDSKSPGAQALDRRLAELDSRLAALRAAQAPAPVERPSVRIVALEGSVTPGPKDSPLGRLSLRLEVGANFVRAGEPPDYFYHRGPTTRLSILARHRVGARGRVHLLFGPYYGFSRVTQFARPDGDAWYAGPITSHRVGGQFEVQWVPAARLERWLSLNPALEVGLEQQGYAGRGSGRATGFQAGGGLALCIYEQVVCPGARALVSPLSRGNAVVAIQAGVALDVMRLADIGLRAAASKRRPR